MSDDLATFALLCALYAALPVIDAALRARDGFRRWLG